MQGDNGYDAAERENGLAIDDTPTQTFSAGNDNSGGAGGGGVVGGSALYALLLLRRGRIVLA